MKTEECLWSLYQHTYNNIQVDTQGLGEAIDITYNQLHDARIYEATHLSVEATKRFRFTEYDSPVTVQLS